MRESGYSSQVRLWMVGGWSLRRMAWRWPEIGPPSTIQNASAQSEHVSGRVSESRRIGIIPTALLVDRLAHCRVAMPLPQCPTSPAWPFCSCISRRSMIRSPLGVIGLDCEQTVGAGVADGHQPTSTRSSTRACREIGFEALKLLQGDRIWIFPDQPSRLSVRFRWL